VAAGGQQALVAGQVGAAARILLLDDDSMLRRTTGALLADAGHLVREAQDAAAALATLEEEHGFDLAIVDYSMPDMSGDEFARAARERHPSLPVLFMTGYAGPAPLKGERWCIYKPFRRDDLLALVGEALKEPVTVAC
jgi:CheY-like chemotaxis protein